MRNTQRNFIFVPVVYLTCSLKGLRMLVERLDKLRLDINDALCECARIDGTPNVDFRRLPDRYRGKPRAVSTETGREETK